MENLGKGFEIKSHASGGLRNAWHLKFNFGHASTLEVVISLDAGSRLLCYDVTCDWREFGSEEGIPNLHFHLPFGWKPEFLFDVPFGVKERKPVDMDLPGESFVIAKKSGGPSLGLLSMDKYGFRCLEDSLSLTLIRGAIDPDPTPETGRHRISFALAPFGASENSEDIVRESLIYRRAMAVISGKNQGGKTQDLEPSYSFLKLKGGVLSAIKRAESETEGAQEDKKLVFRVYEIQGKDTTVELSLAFTAASAFISDALEEKRLEDCLISKDGKTLTFKLPKYSVRTLFVELGS
jgi:alpha-mannosidase